MNKNLVITALGKDKPGIVNELSKAILDKGGNITESRMMALSGEFAMMLLVTGEESCIADINSKLTGIGETLGLTITAKEKTLEQSDLNLFIDCYI